MILIDFGHFPKVILHFTTSRWSKPDHVKAVESLIILMKTAIEKNLRIKLFLVGNASKNFPNPPLRYWMWVVKDILKLRTLIHDAVDKTAIFKPSHSMDGFFKLFFSMYTPQRPLKIFKNYSDAVTWLDKK